MVLGFIRMFRTFVHPPNKWFEIQEFWGCCKFWIWFTQIDGYIGLFCCMVLTYFDHDQWCWPLWSRGASKFGGSLASWSATPTESIGTWCDFSNGNFARNLDQGFGNPTVSWCWLGKAPTRDRKGIERVVYCTSLQFPRIPSISKHVHSNDCQIGWDRGGWTIFGYITYITNCCCAECYRQDPNVIEPSKLLVLSI